MSNLWYKVAEYSNLSGRHQELDSNIWKPGNQNDNDPEKHRENYWKNLSSMGPDDTVAYSAIHGDWKRLIHRTCVPEFEKNNFKDELGRKYDVFKPISFQELRQKQSPFWAEGEHIFPRCLHCASTIVPSRPHSEKECGETKFRSMDKGKCSDSYQLRPEGTYWHKCQHGLDEACLYHGGFDPKDAFPQGHITDEQVKNFGTGGDLETLLGSEAEYRLKNNLPLNLGGRNK